MKLERSGNNYYINSKKKFEGLTITKDVIIRSFDFAYDMAYGEGHHRSYRSGGRIQRSPFEIFNNSLQGKISEIIIYKELTNQGFQCKGVDFSISGRGVWDDVDLKCKGKNISIKSTAYFSNLLLLESNDWNKAGEYIPNLKHSQSAKSYDYLILVRIKPTPKHVMKKGDEIIINNTEVAKNYFTSQNWEYDIAGYCTSVTLRYIIKEGYILPQNSLLNGQTRMDAENYYIQTGSLRSFKDLINKLNTF